MKALLMDGNIIRLVTVIFIVFTTAILSVMGALNEAVSALYGGIVGYVLGSMHEMKSRKKG
ncbi:MAG: hypothetical protein KAI55_00670 [Candidatus Aenigmarchaeota archaeon]|nr:hypothetical protein [Candidatus Aenigmarchaeota archaeon]